MVDNLHIAAPTLEPKRTGFILSEEESLKRYLAGSVTLPSKRSGDPDREVPVYFRSPDSSRSIKYPYMLIDLVSVRPAYDLWHSEVEITDTPSVFEDLVAGTSTVGMYYPSTTADATPDPSYPYTISRYLPYRLIFQISTFANSSIDDKYMHSILLVNILPPRSFWVDGLADQVWRRCELLDWVQADKIESMEATKRIFQKVYTISMETEVPTSALGSFTGAIAERLHVDILDKDFDEHLPPGHSSTADHSSILDVMNNPPIP